MGSSLKSVSPQLRGSYTSLKPVNKNLPVAPPPLNSRQVYPSQGEINKTVKLARNEVGSMLIVRCSVVIGCFQTFKVPLPVGDAQNLPVADGVAKPLTKNNVSRGANTGIPRPVSRIPAPRGVR